MEDDDWDDDLAVNHVSKRARRSKNTVVVFDDADRKEFLSGFRKRKDKRRQVALQQKAVKERQKRIQDRRERRAALKGVAGDDEQDGQPKEPAQDEDEQVEDEVDRDVSDTATYEDAETITVVHVTNLAGAEEDADVKIPSVHAKSERHGTDNGTHAKKLKIAKMKLKKQKKPNLEKRMKKTSKRDKAKSMSKHSRSKNRKKGKK